MSTRNRRASSRLTVGVMCLTLCLSTVGMIGTAAAVPIVQTNSSWKITPDSPSGTSWYSNAAFDDSGWQDATVLYDYGAVVGDPAFNGTKIIWSSEGQFSNTETQVWIRYPFSLGMLPSSASLFVGCDDDCAVWVNGNQVINDANGFANNTVIENSSLLPFLNVGQNLIAYTALDNFPVFGFNHSTALQLDGTFASTAVPEPSALVLTATGLLGLIGMEMRRRWTVQTS